MRPIPATRIGESHGLLRAISKRERVRLDEFVTEFPAEELFLGPLESALSTVFLHVGLAERCDSANVLPNLSAPSRTKPHPPG